VSDLENGAAPTLVNGVDPSVVPIASIVRIYVHKGNRLVQVKCPYCRQLHTHGWPVEDGNGPTHRGAHCAGVRQPGTYGGYRRPEGSGAGYVIELPAGDAE
jgi:hypothetical protein